eukprot:TRINITY_DN7094_c0_g1_i1.p1 TRINITY_DN7094_c0_g1~~TRINITY_DN7094_c0_g1_i1.p1  ORF type:complete len:401 (+),score=55.79 TRINITY_DN7094_c0_g1_i1:27-1229(+)
MTTTKDSSLTPLDVLLLTLFGCFSAVRFHPIALLQHLFLSLFRLFAPVVFLFYRSVVFVTPLYASWLVRYVLGRTTSTPSRVVIVGGGFAGSCVASVLSLQSDISLTYVDEGARFQYTPSILKGAVGESNERVVADHRSYLGDSVRIVRGRMSRLDAEKKRLTISLNASASKNREASGGGPRGAGGVEHAFEEEGGYTVDYDFLVLSTGSSYHVPKRLGSSVFHCDSMDGLQASPEALRASSRILIIGGGITGVELAAEIITRFPSKEVTLVHGGDRLLPAHSDNPRVQQYVQSFLEQRGVKLLLNNRVVSRGARGEYILRDGELCIYADCAYFCANSQPNLNFAHPFLSSQSPTSLPSPSPSPSLPRSLSPEGLLVEADMRVRGFEDIFAGGDVVSLKG